MAQGTIHIIGAGLAGLSAATRLAEKGQKIIVYEASGQAGGRCRSYHDAAFGGVIGNRNHLLLSGNDAALSYLRRIGAGNPFAARKPSFDFIDAQSKQRWTLRLNEGRIPFWLLDASRRVPDTKASDYLCALRLLRANAQQTITSLLSENSVLYKRLWHPLLLSALNTEPSEASARLAAAIVRGTLLKGGRACIPLVAEGLSSVFIDPALTYLSAHQGRIFYNHRLKNIILSDGKPAALEFTADETVPVSAKDTVICAVPAWNISQILPDIQAPDDFRAILNLHFRIAPPEGLPAITGVINATTEWIFAFPDRISITVSGADRLMQEDREVLASRIWQEVSSLIGLSGALPPWQVVKEKRATFAATPAQEARRPATRTPWKNIWLAGDYVRTGLPATIEGAILSGLNAAESAMKAA